MADKYDGNLYTVNLPYANFGIIENGGKVTYAAPIAKWAIGKSLRDVEAFYRRKGGEITAHSTTAQMIVVNKRTHTPTPQDVYIGRPSPLGNPFSHLPNTLAQYKVHSRDDAILFYRRWLRDAIVNNNQDVIQALLALPDDAVLVCWCKPASCHGDVIIRAAAWLKTQHTEN